MTKQTITVKYVNAPPVGKKKGSIKTNDGRIFGVWPDKLADFKVGGSYEIEVESNEFNGKTYYSIKSATPVNGSSPTPAATPANTYVNGRSPETQARIERQHSQNMALLFMALFGNARPEDTDTLVHVKELTDHFQIDIDKLPVAAKASGDDEIPF